MATLEEALDLDASRKETYLALGRAYRRMGRLRAELALWHRRAELDPSDADASERIGWILWFTGRADEALPWLDASIAQRAAGRWAGFYIGNAHLRLGDHAAAERAYRRVLTDHPDHSSAHAGVAWALLAAERDEEARRHVADMRARALDGDRIYVKRADLELFMGEAESALEDARAALAEDAAARYWPRGVCASTILAAVSSVPVARREALDESVALDEARLSSGDEGPMPRYDLAAVHALHGDADGALRWLRDAVGVGWWYPDIARRDPLLASLRGDARFTQMLKLAA